MPPWDAELTTYDSTVGDVGLPILAKDPHVQGIAIGYTRLQFVIAGQRVDGLVLDPAKGGLGPSIVEGHAPLAADQIVLGSRTMRDLGVGIGDRIQVATLADAASQASMEVVGRAVFPVFADAGQLGQGLYTSRAGGARIAGETTLSSSSLLIRLAPGASMNAVVDELQTKLGPVADIEQGRPTDIVDFGQVRRTPDLLISLLAVIAAVLLVQVLVTAPRRRHTDLAVLHALGFERAQVRAAVTWQAITTIAAALVVGVPIGILVGLSVWRRFADGLGVILESEVHLGGIAALIVGGLLGAVPLAVVPAQAASRSQRAMALRSE